MRILYHHRTRSRDGQRVHIEGLVGALRRAGHELEIVEPRPRREQAEAAGGAKLGVATSGAAQPGDGGPPKASALRELAELAYNVPERWQLQRAVRRFRPDAIYSRHALYTTCAAAVARAHDLPLLIEVNAPLAQERSAHGGLRFAAFARKLETAVLNRADRVIVVTRAMAAMMAAQGVADTLIEVHHNGLEPEALSRTLEREKMRAQRHWDDRVVLGFVGFVRDWNRLERVFPWLVRNPGALLAVVGEGPDRARLEGLAAAAGIPAQVQFLGTLRREQVLDHVAAFDVALLPEVTAYASPLKLLDYFAAARAALLPDRPNLRELIDDGVNGLLFDPADDASFAAKIDLLVADPQLRQRLGTQGRQTIVRLGLTWDANAQRVITAIETARARRGAHGQ
ncbi:MAG: glycosyltransferase [Planctomycetes bacterium]|nr:glycosyltransferase [Planctomycetota bacterium]